MTLDVGFAAIGSLFALGSVSALATAVDLVRARRIWDAAFWLALIVGCVYFAAHAFLAALPIA